MDARDAIRDEFMREYARSEAGHVAVRGLCAATPVARTTFYYYYQNADDVLRDVEDILIAGLRQVAADESGGNMRGMDFDAFTLRTVEYIRSQWDWFRALLVDQPDRRFEDKLKAAIVEHFGMRYPEKRHVANYGILGEIMASAVLGGYRYWLAHPAEVQARDLARIVTQTLNQFVAILR